MKTFTAAWVIIILAAASANAHPPREFNGQVIDKDTGRPVSGLLLFSDLSPGGVITSAPVAPHKLGGTFTMHLPASTTSGTPLQIRIKSERWVLLEPFDGRIVLQDGVQPTIWVASKGSLSLVRDSNRLVFLCRMVTAAAVSNGWPQYLADTKPKRGSGSPQHVPGIKLNQGLMLPPPNIREKLLDRMAAETGISKPALIREILSLVGDTKRDPADRASAAWFAGDYQQAANYYSMAAEAARARKIVEAQQEALYRSLEGWSHLNDSKLEEAERAFVSSHEADATLTDAINGLTAVCLGRAAQNYQVVSSNDADDKLEADIDKCKLTLHHNLVGAVKAIREADPPDETKEARILVTIRLWKNDADFALLDEDDVLSNDKTLERAQQLLENSTETHSSDLPETIFLALTILQDDAGDLTTSQIIEAINRALISGKRQYLGTFPSEPGLLNFRAKVEVTPNDILDSLRDYRQSVELLMAFDKLAAAQLAQTDCFDLKKLLFVNPPSLKSQMLRIAKAATELCDRTIVLYGQTGALNAARGNRDFGDQLAKLESFIEDSTDNTMGFNWTEPAAHQYSVARTLAIAAKDNDVRQDCEWKLITALSDVSTTVVPRKSTQTLSCDDLKQIQQWLPTYQMSDTQKDDERFPTSLQKSRDIATRLTRRCSQTSILADHQKKNIPIR